MDGAESDQPTMAMEGIEDEDQMVETLVQEGDEDASLVADFEAAAADVLQNDEELAAALTSYQDARRRPQRQSQIQRFLAHLQQGKKRKGSQGPKRQAFRKGHPSLQEVTSTEDPGVRCRCVEKWGIGRLNAPADLRVQVAMLELHKLPRRLCRYPMLRSMRFPMVYR